MVGATSSDVVVAADCLLTTSGLDPDGTKASDVEMAAVAATASARRRTMIDCCRVE